MNGSVELVSDIFHVFVLVYQALYPDTLLYSFERYSAVKNITACTLKRCTLKGMTLQLAEVVREQIDKRGLTLSEYAKEMGFSRQYLGDLLALRKGNMPGSWETILGDLGLELVVQVKRPGSKNS